MKRSKLNTRKRRNRLYEPTLEKVIEPTKVFKLPIPNTLESLEDASGEDIFHKAARDYLDSINTPIPEPTREIPGVLNHDTNQKNYFYVFEKEHAEKIAFWQAVLVVSLGACLLLGALIISWRLHLPEWCFRP